MPRYDAAPTFDTVSDSSTLFDHAVGYRNDHADLAGNIQLFLSGLDYGQAAGDPTLTIDDLTPGNEVSLDIVSPHWAIRSEEHTSELQSLMRISYAVFCLKKKKTINTDY